MIRLMEKTSLVLLGLLTLSGPVIWSAAYAAPADDAAAAAKTAVDRRTSPQTTWLGPTTGRLLWLPSWPIGARCGRHGSEAMLGVRLGHRSGHQSLL
jgi:hypothetical protein